MSRTQLAGTVRAGLQIRSAVAADCEAISSFVTGLSLRTRFLRFFAPASPPSPSLLRGLCGVTGSDVLLATDGSEVVGHAMAADSTGPDGGRVADIGLVVADSWQNRGVGSAMLQGLADRAAERGVSALVMDVLPENRRMLEMISRHWADASYEFRPDAVTVRVPLPGAPHRGVAA
jgi:ribosomal protein S18 acetylase RimI-like enzyme